MLKYEGLPLGAVIRAYDFEPCGDFRDNLYVEGVIYEVYDEAFKGYRIRCTRDSACDPENPHRRDSEYSREGLVVTVPFEIAGFDWDGRVVDITKDDGSNLINSKAA